MFSNTATLESVKLPSNEEVISETFRPSEHPMERDGVQVSPECFCVVLINIRSILSKKSELEARLQTLQPHVVCVQETWLDGSVENLEVKGYTVVTRRDRTSPSGDEGYGGILVLARVDVESVAALEKSAEDERAWCTVHTSMGPVLLGNWYRPPSDDPRSSMPRCRAELGRLMEDHVGTILVGDINAHHRRWLVHSNKNSIEGKLMWDICTDFGLQQGVREPTRGPYLLDLVMSDMLGMGSVKVYAPIADHNLVVATFDVTTASAEPIERFVWEYRRARWDDLRADLGAVDWKSLLQHGSGDDAAEALTNTILEKALIHIPHRTARFTRRSHAWITQRAQSAIQEKCAAFGTDKFDEASRRCNAVIAEEYRAYTKRLRSKISNLRRGSKQWWSLNRQLLHKTSKVESIPPLKDDKGNWVTEREDKAQLLAATFESKSSLPPPPAEASSHPDPLVELSGFLVIRSRWAKKVLKQIDVSKATGPDGLPGRILRECASVLATPVATLARRLLREGVWPDKWKMHWIHPLYKKGSTADGRNYRGVHLTSVLSKSVERTISHVFVPFLDAGEVYGKSQWAFRPKRSCKDLVTLKMAQWILAIGRGKRVGLFLSDIAGAFDRVDSEILLRKCVSAGLGREVCGFLKAFLAPRKAVVLAQGKPSAEMSINNEVYQGTVLGPPLWNVHFADVTVSATRDGFRETKVADDLSCDKEYDKKATDNDIFTDLRRCQANVHQWGVQNRVQFDAKKEEMKILHGQRGCGEPFKFLGPMVDVKLVMDTEVQRSAERRAPKSRRFCARVLSTAFLDWLANTKHMFCRSLKARQGPCTTLRRHNCGRSTLSKAQSCTDWNCHQMLHVWSTIWHHCNCEGMLEFWDCFSKLQVAKRIQILRNCSLWTLPSVIGSPVRI